MTNREIVQLRKRIRERDIDTKELHDILLTSETRDLERIVDGGLRDSQCEGVDYLQYWLAIGRCFGFATKDDSWGEFEKLFSIIVRRLVIGERKHNNKQGMPKCPDCGGDCAQHIGGYRCCDCTWIGSFESVQEKELYDSE